MSNMVLDVIAKRSSARAYSGEDITANELDAIIDAGLKAPTGMNLRELSFSVVKGDNPVLMELDNLKKELRNQGADAPVFFYNAAYLILISADENEKWAHVDAGIAVQNMSLAAESLGLGNLIIGCIYDALHSDKKEYFNNKFKIPENKNFIIALAIGHRTDSKEPHTYNKDEQVAII